jgi:hypothetical protein
MFEQIPVEVGLIHEGERVRKNDMQVELGGPSEPEKCELVLVRPVDAITDGDISIIGLDLSGMEEGKHYPLGILVEIAGSKVEPDLEGVIERRIHEYSNYIEGFMHLNQRYDIWIRLSKKSFKKGLNSFRFIGQVMLELFRTELPILERSTSRSSPTRRSSSHYIRKPLNGTKPAMPGPGDFPIRMSMFSTVAPSASPLPPLISVSSPRSGMQTAGQSVGSTGGLPQVSTRKARSMQSRKVSVWMKRKGNIPVSMRAQKNGPWGRSTESTSTPRSGIPTRPAGALKALLSTFLKLTGSGSSSVGSGTLP